MACEKCWYDASWRSAWNGRSVAENYGDLLEERRDNPCTLEEQSGKAISEENINARPKPTLH